VLFKLFKDKMNADAREVLPLDVQAPGVWEELLTVQMETESRLQVQESRLKHSNPLTREISEGAFDSCAPRRPLDPGRPSPDSRSSAAGG